MTNISHIRILIFQFYAPVAQPVEHVLGKDEATGSIPVGGLLEFKLETKDICAKIYNLPARNAAVAIIAGPRIRNKIRNG